MPESIILGTVSWTPPALVVFGEFSGTPDRYMLVSNGQQIFLAQNGAGTVHSMQLNFVRGKKYHIEVVPQYRGVNGMGLPYYFSGPAGAIDVTAP